MNPGIRHGLLSPALAVLLLLSGCSKDPPKAENFSGLAPPIRVAAEALDGLPNAKDAAALLTPLVMAVAASAFDGTSFGLAPSRNSTDRRLRDVTLGPRLLSRCPNRCPRVTVDEKDCEAGKPILFAPERSSGIGITFEKNIDFDWGDGCVDEESQTFIAGKAESSFGLTGVGLLVSDNPDELDVQIETFLDLRYREDLSAAIKGGVRGTFAGKKSEDGKTFQGAGGLALDLSVDDPALPSSETGPWLFELDERIGIEKYAAKPDLVYTTRLDGRVRIGTPSAGALGTRIEEVVRSWGFRGGGLAGCMDEPVAGRLILEHPKGAAIDFGDEKCDCKVLAPGITELPIDACKSKAGELLARSVRYLIQLEDFPVIGRVAP